MELTSRIISSILSIVLSVFGITVQNPGYKITQDAFSSPLSVHYIDVGQADGIYIKLPNGENMLIDAGDNNTGDNVVAYLEDMKVKKIDYLVATHPHADHIGGMDDVISSFEIGTMYMPSATQNTKTFLSVLDAIEDNDINLKKAKAGVNILKEDNLSVDILAPCRDFYEEMNNYSAVVKITYGKTSFLFAGDAEKLSENDIDASLKADVLKVGHHGSDTSTGEEFLKKVSPEAAVISVGEDNSYGHPHKELLQRLSQHNVKIFRTDYDGTVVIGSDGEKIVY